MQDKSLYNYEGIEQNKIALLIEEIKKILLKSIELGGSSISDYVDADNKKGLFKTLLTFTTKKQIY